MWDPFNICMLRRSRLGCPSDTEAGTQLVTDKAGVS